MNGGSWSVVEAKEIKHHVFPAAYTLSMLLNVPFTKEKQKYLKEAANGLDFKAPFPASHYVLSQEMMGKLGYPLLIGGLPPNGFLRTSPRSAGLSLPLRLGAP